MSDPQQKLEGEPGLNPALRKRTEEVHDTRHSTPPPAESASVQREEGRSWPIIWAVVTIAGVVLGIWLIFF
jgi:hypothetical protein